MPCMKQNFDFQLYPAEEDKMNIGFVFLFNSVLLGVGLAMDAFSVSLANGLNEPYMKKSRMCGIAGRECGITGRLRCGGIGCHDTSDHHPAPGL